ncbi:MAG: ROK family transcriptional regulator [Microbacterium sp.]
MAALPHSDAPQVDGTVDLRRIRLANEARVLRQLADNGGLTRRQLAEATGLSRTTISAIVRDLAAEGGLVSGGHVVSDAPERGRPVEIIRLSPHGGLVIGCEFGRGHVAVAIANYAHEVVASAQRDLPRSAPLIESPDLVDLRIEAMVELLRSTAANAGMTFAHARGLGVAISGLHPHAENGSPLVESLIERLVEALDLSGIESHWDNNLRLAARAEARLHPSDESDNLMYIALSHGVGSGMTVDGSSLAGAGSAGEFGHVVVRPDGRRCECGLHGCVERYLSVDAILDDARSADPSVTDLGVLAAKRGTPTIARLIAERGRLLGQAVSVVRAVVDPTVVVLGGDLTVIGDPLIAAAREYLSTQHIGTARFRLEPARLARAAAAIGAVYLALEEQPIR